MIRTFVQTFEFQKKWKELGLDDDDLRRLELIILDDPKAAPVIKGTGKLRKLRFAYPDRGKSGSIRVCYVDFVLYETIYLITAYPKTKKDDLTKSECMAIRSAINEIEENLKVRKK